MLSMLNISRWGAAVFLVLLSVSVFAQQSYSTVKNTSEKALRHFKEGRSAIQEGDPAAAIRAYRKAVETDSLFIDGWIYLAGAHRESQHWTEAEKALERALHLGPDYDPRMYPMLADIEWQQDKYAEAAQYYQYYMNSGHGNERDRAEAARQLANARFAANAVLHPLPFHPEPLGAGVNTSGNEYFPVLTADGQTLIFTRLDGDDENFYQSSRLPGEKEDWATAMPLEGVNTPYNEGAQAISADGSWLAFTACDRRDDGSQGSCDIYWSQKKTEGWSKAAPFSSTINSTFWDAQPTISADGKTIIFSSNRTGALGKQDLWETTRQAGGKWSTPRNLGPEINTTGSDCFPFLHPDGQTLYFTSDGHPGFGHFDIYVSRRRADGSWGKPENFGYPINTKDNESNLVTSLDGRTAYFSAKRSDGPGGIDIFRFELPESLRPTPATYVRARVTDALTGQPLAAKVTFTNLSDNTELLSAQTKKDGTFLAVLPSGRDYSLQVTQKGYLFHSEHFKIEQTASLLHPYSLEIALQPIGDTAATAPVGQHPVVLKNVFFESGSAVLRPASTVELDALTKLLTEHPELNIQINGHTDSEGDAAANQKLSEQRAQSVQQYLIGKGIAIARLRAKGFGETKPVASNDTDEGRSLNRRTEFERWKR